MAEMTIEQMRTKVQEADMAAMSERQIENEKAMKPMNDFLAAKALAEVKKQTEELAVVYASDMAVSQKVNALRMALQLF